MSEEQPEYGLEVSYYIDTDGYSDRDREMFVCGAEYQMIYESIKAGEVWSKAIHTENASRVRMLCKRLNAQVSMVQVCSTWTICTIAPD